MKPKAISPIDFEALYPDVQSRRARFSQLSVKTFNAPISAGTALLPNKGDIALQTSMGTTLLVVNIGGGTCIYYTPAGTL